MLSCYYEKYEKEITNFFFIYDKKKLTYRGYFPFPLEIDFIANEDDAVIGHVIALPQVEQHFLRGLETSSIHHRIDNHVNVWIVGGTKGLDLYNIIL